MMKKLLVLILAMVMIVSFAGCGRETETVKETTDSEETVINLKLGETAATDKVEFVLKNVKFADKLGYEAGSYYLSPVDKASNSLVPKDGNVFVYFEFTVKNIGKTELNKFGYTKMKMVYSDGYTFEVDPYREIIRTDDGLCLNLKATGSVDIEVLSEAQEYRGYVEVPVSVKENADLPLDFVISLINEDNSSQDFIFNIR